MIGISCYDRFSPTLILSSTNRTSEPDSVCELNRIEISCNPRGRRQSDQCARRRKDVFPRQTISANVDWQDPRRERPLTPSIEVENLVKVFPSKRGSPTRALDGVSFSVSPGEIFGLLGPNGAGKSTVVRILTTITPPTSGMARVNGYDVVRSPLETRRQLAVVLQETAVEMLLSVRDNLLSMATCTINLPRSCAKESIPCLTASAPRKTVRKGQCPARTGTTPVSGLPVVCPPDSNHRSATPGLGTGLPRN